MRIQIVIGAAAVIAVLAPFAVTPAAGPPATKPVRDGGLVYGPIGVGAGTRPATKPAREGIVGIGIGTIDDLKRALPTYLGMLFLQQGVSEIGLDDATRTKAAAVVDPGVKSAYELVAGSGKGPPAGDADKAAWELSRHVQGRLTALLTPAQMDVLDKQDSTAFIQFYILASRHDQAGVVSLLTSAGVSLTDGQKAAVKDLTDKYDKAVARPHDDPTKGYYEWPLLLDLRRGLRGVLTAEQVKTVDAATVKALEDENRAEMSDRERQANRAATRPVK